TVLFGAMAGSGALPFSRAACEDAIRQAGKAVDASLAGFAAGYEQARALAGAAGAGMPDVAAAAGPALSVVHGPVDGGPAAPLPSSSITRGRPMRTCTWTASSRSCKASRRTAARAWR